MLGFDNSVAVLSWICVAALVLLLVSAVLKYWQQKSGASRMQVVGVAMMLTRPILVHVVPPDKGLVWTLLFVAGLIVFVLGYRAEAQDAGRTAEKDSKQRESQDEQP